MSTEDIFNAIRSIRLSDNDRAMMRGDLRVFMHEHPLRLSWWSRVTSMTMRNNRPVYSWRMIEVAFAAIAIVFLGAGTSYAAENSLPGDPLYAVKINVNEPIEGAFALSTSAQASWDVTLADRRLAEAEKLAAQGKLTPAVTEATAAQVAISTQHVNAVVSHLAKDKGDVASVAAAQAQLETSLSAHAQVLVALSAAAPDSKSQIEPILATLETSVKSADTTGAQVTGALAAADIANALGSADDAAAQTALTTAVTASSSASHAHHDTAATATDTPDPAATDASSTSTATSSDPANASSDATHSDGLGKAIHMITN